MKRIRVAWLAGLLISCSLFTSAQSPGDDLVPGRINYKFLEHLVKEQIDSVRIAHHLAALVNDSILYIAAKDHSSYLVARNKMGHFQPDIPKKVTPLNRVEFYGGKFEIVGENVISTFILVPLKDKIKGKE